MNTWMKSIVGLLVMVTAIAHAEMNAKVSTPSDSLPIVEKLAFKALANQVGQLTLWLPSATTPYSFVESSKHVVLHLSGVKLAKLWQQTMQTQQLGSIVTSIKGQETTVGSQVTVAIKGAYQVGVTRQDKRLVLTVKPRLPGSFDEETHGFHGKKISLNFQDISVRGVLKILAEFTGLNIVTSDAVTGNITLHLKHVPWDQALDIILRAKGLGERRVGNVIYIAPATEIAAQEKIALEARKQAVALAPLESAFFQVKYADAAKLASLIESAKNGFLSPRGSVTVDHRTNTLLVKDTAARLTQISKLLKRLDVPVKQVLIEARIVVADETALEEMGVTLKNNNSGTIARSGANSLQVSKTLVTAPVSGAVGTLGLALGRLPSGFNLDLELQALESQGNGKVISSPHLTVSNKQEASIEQGSEVPYLAQTSSGANQVQFKKAVLGLKVTPQITPDGKVIMVLQVNNDSLTKEKGTAGDIPVIATAEVKTKVLVNNGETIVLGGIFKHDKRKDVKRVPFFGSIPIVGWLFRNTSEHNNRNELLIFVTPKIVGTAQYQAPKAQLKDPFAD